MEITHRYSWKNDGEPHVSTPLDRAVNEAKLKFYQQSQRTEWDEIWIQSLPCDQKDEHYPDLCYHYAVTVYRKERDAKNSGT